MMLQQEVVGISEHIPGGEQRSIIEDAFARVKIFKIVAIRAQQ
jgi:hypothetical protein